MIRAGFKGVQTVPMNSKVVGPTSRKEGHQWKVKKDIVSKSAEPPLSAVNTTFAAHRRRLQDGAHSIPTAINQYLVAMGYSAAHRPAGCLAITLHTMQLD